MLVVESRWSVEGPSLKFLQLGYMRTFRAKFCEKILDMYAVNFSQVLEER